jgi:hypothetical protein
MGKKKKCIAFEEIEKKNLIFDHKSFLEINSMDQTKFMCF